MSGVYEIYIKDNFAAAHALKGYEGDCSDLHGHNWTVEIFIRSTKLDRLGMGIDFKDVKKAAGEVLKRLDHTNLNEISWFENMNPTSENLSRTLYEELSKKLNTEYVRVSKVNVLESRDSGSSYWEE